MPEDKISPTADEIRVRTELDHVTDRLINYTRTGEGSTLPPRVVAGFRIPFVKNLRIVKAEPFFSGTEFTLVWTDPEDRGISISRFNVYASGILGSSRPLLLGSVDSSPALFRIETNQVEPITFYVQTQLTNGQSSDLFGSPTAAALSVLSAIPSGAYGTNSVPLSAIQNGTPGQLITWGALGPITTIGPGSADNILVGAGAGAVPVFKSRTTLDLVEGRGNLTDAGAVPYVASSGTLTDNPTNFFWNNSTLSLGIGTNVPTARLHLPAGGTAADSAPLKITSGSLLTTAEAGTVEYDGKKYYVTPVSTRRVVDITSDTKTSNTTVANTVTETSLYSASLAANTAAIGQIYRVRVFGYFSTANGVDTFTLRFKIGGTTVISIVSTAGSVTDTPFDIEFVITVRTLGGSGTVHAYAAGQFNRVLVSVSDTATTTVDTTTNNTFDVTVQWSNADAGNTLTCTQGFFQIRG